MSFSDLATAICNTEFKLDQDRQSLAQRLDVNRLLEICKMYRCIGCGSYLMDLSKDAFANNLFFSAKSYLYILQKVKSKELPDHLGWRSKGDAWFDVIAIGAKQLAMEMSAYSAVYCNEDQGEIEEDFLYFKLIEGLYLEALSENEIDQTIGQFEKACEGGDSNRYQVVKALCHGNATVFDQMFHDMIDNWKYDNAQDLKIGRLNPYYYTTFGKIFIEGLALIKIAKILDFPTRLEYPFIPADVIQYQPSQFPIDFELVHG